MSTSRTNTQSAAERRAAEAELRRLMIRFSRSRQRLVAAVRRWVRRRLPAAHEVVYDYRDCFIVSFSPSERGYEGVLAIRGDGTGVRLYFNRGRELPDPANLLQGSGGQTRWIPVERTATLTLPAVVDLVNAALAHNAVPFAPSGRGSVVVRSTSAKRRRSS